MIQDFCHPATRVPCHMHSTWPSHSPFFLSFIILVSVGRYNLWSYTVCSFLKFPITFSHKSLRTDKHCCQTQFTVSSHCQKVSHPQLCKYYINTHISISIIMLSDSRKESKTLWSCIEHYSKLISSQFLDSAIFIP